MTKPLNHDSLWHIIYNTPPDEEWRMIKRLRRHKNIKIQEFNVAWHVGVVGDWCTWVIVKPRTCDKCKHTDVICTHKPCRRCIWKDEHPCFEPKEK